MPLSASVKEANLVLFLDYPGWLCALHYLQRFVKHRRVARPELPDDCYDKLKIRTFWMILTRKERKILTETLASVEDSSKIVTLGSPREAEIYLKSNL